MARLEDEVHQGSGLAREWLARAPRAPRDPAWIADNIISDAWAPLSPTTGKIDAFIWQTPAEQLSSPIEPLPQQQMQRLDAPTEPASELKPEADQASHKTVTEEHSEASMGPAFKSIPKPPTEAPLRGLELDQLRHFTAPDDPGPEDETRHS
jgi:HemY protein